MTQNFSKEKKSSTDHFRIIKPLDYNLVLFKILLSKLLCDVANNHLQNILTANLW